MNLFIDTSNELRKRRSDTVPIHMEYGTFSREEEANMPNYENIHYDRRNERLEFVLEALKTHRGEAILALFLFIIFAIIGYFCFVFFGPYTNITFIDKRGNIVQNVHNFSDSWKKMDIVKTSENRPPIKTNPISQDDIENGYFQSYIYGIGKKKHHL